jgi:hypothetical protein
MLPARADEGARRKRKVTAVDKIAGKRYRQDSTTASIAEIENILT